MSIIQTFLYDPDFINNTSILDPILRTGGICVPSSQALSYFVNPQEFPDERTARASNLNVILTGVPRLIIDQAGYGSLLTDINNIWSLTERQNLFAIIDQLCFAYSINATVGQVETALSSWPQYLTGTFVYSTTHSVTPVYPASSSTIITVPDYVTFTFQISNGTQYQFRVWLNNTLFRSGYPLSTIRAIVPPLPLSILYGLSISSSTESIFTTAKETASESQSILQNYIQSGQYSGYLASVVTFVDGGGDSAPVQFNILYNGAAPGAIAVRNAIRAYLLGSGVGTSDGWNAIAPSLFVTESFYLLPTWDMNTSLVDSIIYPNIIPIQKAISNAQTIMFDVSLSFVSANLNIITSFYNNITILAVPDVGNDSTRLLLANEHPTYQDVPTTSILFSTMTTNTQSFASLLGLALSEPGALQCWPF